MPLPIVKKEVMHSIAQEGLTVQVEEAGFLVNPDWGREQLDRIGKINPVIVTFIRGCCEPLLQGNSDIKIASNKEIAEIVISLSIMVYRLLESQAESDDMEKSIKL